MKVFKRLALLALFVLAACSAPQNNLTQDSTSDIIEGQYIVVLNDGLQSQSVATFDLSVASVASKYAFERGANLQLVNGFVARGVSAADLRQLELDPQVNYIQQDRIVTIMQGGKPGGGGTQPAQVVPWGIQRIGAVGLTNTGANVEMFVLDTGIDLDHPDLVVVDGYAVETCKGGGCLAAYDDDNDHGTHVAGTIAALNNDIGVVGIAPDARLHAVKILNTRGSGTFSGIIEGIDWVTAYETTLPKVINMSLGGGGSQDGPCYTAGDAFQDAICRAVDSGVTVVVAAGNSDDDSANHVPAAYDVVISVSATGDRDDDALTVGDDFFAYFSNWGLAAHSSGSADVDMAAPGYHVLSTIPGGDYASFNGTSMASPHVAGGAVLYLNANPTATPAQVQNALDAAATTTALFENDSSGSHPEWMLDVSTF